jgi:hypothetical protein
VQRHQARNQQLHYERFGSKPLGPRAAIPSDVRFNQSVYIDVFYIAGHPLLPAVCAGTRYTAAVFMVSKRTADLWVFCRSDQFSRSSFVDDNSFLLVSSLPFLFYTMTSQRDIYIYEKLRNDYTVPTRCRSRHRGGMVDPLGCKACRVLCAAKDETSVEFMGRMFCCNLLRKS